VIRDIKIYQEMLTLWGISWTIKIKVKGERSQLNKENTAIKSRPSIEAEEEPPGCTPTPIELDEEPPSTQLTYKDRFFSKVSARDWNDWKWHFRNRITTVEELAKYLPLSANEQTQINLVTSKYPLAITPYYLSLIKTILWQSRQCPVSRKWHRAIWARKTLWKKRGTLLSPDWCTVILTVY
jgi:hypothetical protein